MRWFYGQGLWYFMIAKSLTFLVWAGIIVGIIYLVKSQRLKHIPDRDDTALNILKERYARGEITDEEFERMKNKL